MRKGISPVIATVIIVAVAIAISIAVAGWLMGLWGTFGTTEQVQVLPTTTLTNATGTVTLHLCVKNTGSKAATITDYEIVGVTNGPQPLSSPITLDPGDTACTDISATLNGVKPGAQYAIKVYTDTGGVYQGYVVASAG